MLDAVKRSAILQWQGTAPMGLLVWHHNLSTASQDTLVDEFSLLGFIAK
jgi:hypothetical protein